MSVAKEFRDFIARGNVMDLAVGVIIGGAFGQIVNSLVNDIVMPPIAFVTGNVNFKDIKIILRDGYIDASGKSIDAVSENVGNFFQVVFNFMIIALVIFVIIKVVNRVKREQETKDKKEEKKVVEDSKEVMLLMEIRDSLKKKETK